MVQGLRLASLGPVGLLLATQATASQPPATTPAGATQGTIENSVVTVFSTALYPDVNKPWTRRAPVENLGSGVIIEGKRILTNAHLVIYASQVQVQAYQGADKMPAKVEAIAPGIDLAVLRLDDPTFFDSHRPLVCDSTLPGIQDAVAAYGYPVGGSNLSVTKGIVSRIEFAYYGWFAGVPVSGLRIQIDAAINPGNSGGPVVVGDKMIGLAYRSSTGAEKIGYIIPCEEISLFLQDIADGRYDGKPVILDELQTLENEALRAFLKVPRSVEGMLVRQVLSNDRTYPLKKWDVITKIGDTRIDSQGMIKLSANLRVRFQYMIQHLAKDSRVPVSVWRGGQDVQVEVPTPSSRAALLPNMEGAYPSYFVYGPLVFSNSTMAFVSSYHENLLAYTSVATGPMVKRFLDNPAFEGERLVVVSSPFFPHVLSKGYGNPTGLVVKTVNGLAIKNLAHLVELLRDCTEEFVTIEFSGRGTETLVFPNKQTLAATEEILSANGVRSQASPDMLLIWSARVPRSEAPKGSRK